MLRRKSVAYQKLDLLFADLGRGEQIAAIWYYSDRVQQFYEFEPIKDRDIIRQIDALFGELDDVELQMFVAKFEQVICRPLQIAADAFIVAEDEKFPDKLLVATSQMPEQKIRSRALSQFFAGYNVSASNLSATLDQLEKQELLELQPLIEGREKEFTLTAAGMDRRKRILKKLAQNPSP